MVSPVNLLDLVYIPVGLATAPIWLRKKREGWDQRFGRVGPMLRRQAGDSGRPRVLLHAVSVGETNALRALVPMLAETCEVIVSATTDTGLARAQSLYHTLDHVEVVRYPLDCSWMVDRFLDTVRPDVVGLVELEVWPNFIARCRKREIPIGIINGRLSARSFKGYKRLRAVLRPMFARLAFACAQDERYADRLRAMGVRDDRVSVTGSMKWDSIDAGDREGPSERALGIARAMGVDLSRLIVVAGSTAQGEEALLDKAVGDSAQLICAPRKPERFDEAASAMPGCARRSAHEHAQPGTTRFLLDTIGELSAVYELADVVVVGRSFGDLYGSDPTEPAALGKPVLIGPANSDFTQAIEALRSHRAICVVAREALAGELARLLGDAEERRAMGERARRCVREQQGASARHAAVLRDHLPSRSV